MGACSGGRLPAAGLFTQPAALGAVAFLTVLLRRAALARTARRGRRRPLPLVNRNLIELFAALALATLPTGCWAGLDFWIRRFTTAAAARRDEPALAAAVR